MWCTSACHKQDDWDAHPDIKRPYQPAEHLRGVYQDMSLPLPCYFISSGHNSYLTGNQLFSSSGTSTIVKCLQAGCRVIELDVYNGPVCTHGGTLTSCVDFKACVEAVRDYAFQCSPFPVIITLENHADPENQARAAEILDSVLGDALHRPGPTDPRDTYASPQQLIGKIVCRMALKPDTHAALRRLIYIPNAKLASLADALAMEHVGSSSFADSALPKPAELSKPVRKSPRGKERPAGHSTGPAAGHSPGAATEAAGKSPRGSEEERPAGHSTGPATGASAAGPAGGASSVAKAAAKRLRRRLQRLWDDNNNNNTAAQAAHVAAQAAMQAGQGPADLDPAPEDAVRPDDEPPVEGSLRELYAYTARHLMRVYPASRRVLSGNFNPFRAWARGASLAALNWQNWDKQMRVNQGMFADNGGCGYVLKPEWMRAPGAGLPARRPRRLTVRVFSAYRHQGGSWGCFKDDLFVRIRLRGMPGDCAKAHTRTQLNSAALVAEEDFPFDVCFPKLAVLLLELMDEDVVGAGAGHADAELLAYAALPLASLAEGEFRLQLRDPRTGEPLGEEDTWIKVRFTFPPLAPGDGGNG